MVKLKVAKQSAVDALTSVGFSEAMARGVIDDLRKKSSAARVRLAELDAQIAQLKNDRLAVIAEIDDAVEAVGKTHDEIDEPEEVVLPTEPAEGEAVK